MTQAATKDDFLPLAEPYRRELLAHCYRMLGSVHDAEDLVQETYLRAWRGYEGFEGRSSLRTWLYRIATTVCLTALESRRRRPLPSGLGAPQADPTAPLVSRDEVPWLEPIPDALVEDATDPAAVVTSRESIRLALIAALQHLPPKQRAVLILCDVLKWKAAEAATALDTTTAAVNSALQRARAQLADVSPSRDSVGHDLTPRQKALVEQYVAAFERYDVDALLSLFAADAVWEMPPFTGWYQSPAAIIRLIEQQCPAKRAGDLKLVPTAANGQVAFGMYLRGPSGYESFQLQVLELDERGIAHVVAFFDRRLFDAFGLPSTLPVDG